jgi:hypothetical protein
MSMLIGRGGLIESTEAGITPTKAGITPLETKKGERVLTMRDHLYKGETLSLEVLDKRSRSKVKNRKPFLHICLVPHVSNEAVLLSLEGGGSWVVDLGQKVRPLDIYKCGLSMIASKALANKLNEGY